VAVGQTRAATWETGATMSSPAPRAEAVVDLRAIRDNVAAMRARVSGRGLMAVVKADGYGHGMVPAAAAARAGGADWIGVAVLDEALALRAAGDAGPLLCWLAVPGEDYAPAIAADVEVTAYSRDQLAEIVRSARRADRPARLQLKVDTGLNRGGAPLAEWEALVHACRAAERDGLVTVTGIWSHMASADVPGDPSVPAQIKVFGQALDAAEAAGLRPRVRHLANSPTVFTREDAWFDLVRPGLSVYGLSPIPDQQTSADLGLTPAMTLRTSLALVKPVARGEGVSYGHTYVAEHDTVLGLVPLGYGDGILRHASNRAQVWVSGARARIAGRVCMDQFMVDLGPGSTARAGDEVVLFGTGLGGEPTAQDWAEAAGTISYEIVSRLGSRITRTYLGADEIGLAR
jgi:alanine racemase